jgi:hypothetical protein
MIDANEGLYSPNSKLAQFLAQTQLVPLIQNSQTYPPTYKRGSQCIDLIFGSQNIISRGDKIKTTDGQTKIDSTKLTRALRKFDDGRGRL